MASNLGDAVRQLAAAACEPLDESRILTAEDEHEARALARYSAARDVDAAAVSVDSQRLLAALDRALFDRGLVRLAADRLTPIALYLRSRLVRDANATGGRTRGVVAMSTFGENAGFANQMFQYAFLKFYGLRHNLAVAAPPWDGEAVYGLASGRAQRPLRRVKGDPWSLTDLDFWERRRALIDVDFWGYFQNVPPCWHQHRAFLRRLFTPRNPWRDPIERWRERHQPAGTTLIAIHLRRGDYRIYGREKPWFRVIPEEWYLAWLDRIWPTLANPVLFVASDERAAVLPAFARYRPLTAEALEGELPQPRLIADLEIMARADYLAISNSSFSRMAAMLAAPAQRAFIPNVATSSFEPYDPWRWDRFWQRFGAPQPHSRWRLPRFMRRS
jgi:hypothetical protein